MKKKMSAAFFAALILVSAACTRGGGGNGTGQESRDTVPVSVSDSVTEELSDGIPDKTYGGASVRIITAAEPGNGIDVGIESDQAVDRITEAVYKRDRATEGRLDVKLTVRTYETYPDAFNALKTSLDSDADDFDMGFLRTDNAFMLAGDGLLKVNEKHMIGGKLFLAVGQASVNDLLRTHLILFNSNLFDDEKLEYPYSSVQAGTWTIDRLGEYARTLNRDMNGDHVIKTGDDIFGFASFSWTSAFTLWYGCGGNVIEKDEDRYPTVVIDTEKTVDIYGKLYSALISSGSNYVSDGAEYGNLYNSFTEGRVFLTEACMMHLTHWQSFADMKDDYGIIPAPKSDENQKEYISYAEVVEPALCIPKTARADDMLSAAATSLAYGGYQTITPAVYETSLKGRFARDEQSKEMLDIISGSRTSCLALVFIPNTSIVTSVPVLLQNGAEEIASVIDAFREAMTAGLDSAVGKFR